MSDQSWRGRWLDAALVWAELAPTEKQRYGAVELADYCAERASVDRCIRLEMTEVGPLIAVHDAPLRAGRSHLMRGRLLTPLGDQRWRLKPRRKRRSVA